MKKILLYNISYGAIDITEGSQLRLDGSYKCKVNNGEFYVSESSPLVKVDIKGWGEDAYKYLSLVDTTSTITFYDLNDNKICTRQIIRTYKNSTSCFILFTGLKITRLRDSYTYVLRINSMYEGLPISLTPFMNRCVNDVTKRYPKYGYFKTTGLDSSGKINSKGIVSVKDMWNKKEQELEEAAKLINKANKIIGGK